MLTSGIKFKGFGVKKKYKIVNKLFQLLLKQKNEVIKSLGKSYNYSYKKTNLNKYKRFSNIRVIGMGGSTLGSQAIYDFLRHKTKKNFSFIDNLQNFNRIKHKKNLLNLIISKSGNTIETIVNTNIIVKKKEKNIFITENKNNYLNNLAQNLKSEIIHHNNFIGGRFSVLSEVGMIPAELMGFSQSKFKQYNNLIKNKRFINSLISNVNSTLFFIKKKKFNSVILNYDEKADNFFYWYQQLIAESLGKDKIGLLPIVSKMPKDNHSVMQLYLDGFQNNFFTFFFVKESNSSKINNKDILKMQNYLKNKDVNKIIYAQKIATEKVFIKKNIPFRSFEIDKRDEKTIGELFCFFILETILLGRALKLNPFDQPAVELIKTQTKKLLI
tara:strand:+ start:421 stop:1575 length:1155 start_codon:yes stop_codon:yes gene_type:complete